MNQIPDNILQAIGNLMSEALSNGDQVAIPSFGTFAAAKADEHVGTDPESGEQMLFPPSITVQFTPALKLVKQIKEGKTHHE